jgi:hypothetical protein
MKDVPAAAERSGSVAQIVVRQARAILKRQLKKSAYLRIRSWEKNQ